jgi:Dolichyl-phosphate-mannose-protein mannosyltransferase
MKDTKKEHPFVSQAWIAGLLLTSLVGGRVILYSTRWGAALSDDSYFYIHAARDWLAGRGFTLTPHFPPMLPFLLSAVGLFGVDPLVSVRWTNAILFSLNIGLTGWLIYRISRSQVFSLTGALLFLASNTLIEAHSWAMSEPLYLSFSLLGLLFFSKAARSRDLISIIIAGFTFGLAAATRYIGVSLLAAGALVLLTWHQPANTFHRLRGMAAFAIAGSAPLLAWIVRNQLLTGHPTTRVLAWHPLEGSQWLDAINTVLLWIAPGRLVHGNELIWMGVAATILGGWLLWKLFMDRDSIHRNTEALFQSPLIYVFLAYLLSYPITLILARSLFDSRIPLDGRLLSPVLSISLILLMALLARLWSGHGAAIRSAVLITCLYLLFVNGARSIEMVQSYHESGRGYAGERDQISETYAYLRNRPEIPIYSNAMAGVYFWTGRDTYVIPSSAGVKEMKAEMKRTGAYLVIFDSIPVELYQVSRDELTEGLVEQIRLSEATIYRHP